MFSRGATRDHWPHFQGESRQATKTPSLVEGQPESTLRRMPVFR
jgi:hypothetical protein